MSKESRPSLEAGAETAIQADVVKEAASPEAASTNPQGAVAPVEKDPIEATVKDIIVAELRVDPQALTLETHLMKDLGADSLDALNIALRLEDAFKIKIPDDSIPNFLTIGDIIKGVNEHRTLT